MKKVFFVCAVLVSLFSACEKDEGADESLYGALSEYEKQPVAMDFKLIGQVDCGLCKVEDMMMISFEDDSGLPLAEPWQREFNGGEFAQDLRLVPGKKITLFVQAGSSLRKTHVVEVPKDNKAPLDVEITLP